MSLGCSLLLPPGKLEGLLCPTSQTPLFSQQMPQRFVNRHWKSRETMHLHCFNLQASVTALPGDILPGEHGVASFGRAEPQRSKPFTYQKTAKVPQKGLKCKWIIGNQQKDKNLPEWLTHTQVRAIMGNPPTAVKSLRSVPNTLQTLLISRTP